MKKFMLVSLIAGAVLAACEHFPIKSQEENTPELPPGISIVVIDSCEYIQCSRGFGPSISTSIVHKANCRNHGGQP